MERLERDAEGLTDEQRRAAVMADAPELAALLSELQGSLAEVRSHVGPVLNEVGCVGSRLWGCACRPAIARLSLYHKGMHLLVHV